MTYRDNQDIAKNYKSKKWQTVRKQKILLNPFCERCIKKGVYRPVYIVHHKEYITDLNYMEENVFFNINNLESLCLECHNNEHFGEKQEYSFDEDGNLVKND